MTTTIANDQHYAAIARDHAKKPDAFVGGALKASAVGETAKTTDKPGTWSRRAEGRPGQGRRLQTRARPDRDQGRETLRQERRLTMPAMMPRVTTTPAQKLLDRSGDPFVGGAIKPPAAIRESLGMTAPKMPKLGTFKAPKGMRRG